MKTNVDNETLGSHKRIEDRIRYSSLMKSFSDTLYWNAFPRKYDHNLNKTSEISGKAVCDTLKDYINDDYLYFNLVEMAHKMTRSTERLMAVTRTKKKKELKGSKII